MSNSCLIACYHCQKTVYLDKIGWKFTSECSHPHLKGYLPLNVNSLSLDDEYWMMEIGNLEIVNSAKNAILSFLEEHQNHLIYILSDDDIHSGEYYPNHSPKNNQEALVLGNHPSWITTVVFSPNGDYLASGDGRGIIQIWQWKTREKIHTIETEQNYISALVFTADSQTLISGGGDSLLQFWNLETGKLIQSVTGFELEFYEKTAPDLITALQLTGDDQYLISNYKYYRHELKIWALEDLKLDLKVKTAHPNRPRYFDVNSNGLELVTCNSPIAYNHRGNFLATVVLEGKNWRDYYYCLKIWNLETKEVIQTCKMLPYRHNKIYDLKFSPDDQYVAVSVHEIKTIEEQLEGKSFADFFWYEENSLRIYDLKTGKMIKIFPEKHIIGSFAFHPDGQSLVTGNYDFKVREYHLESLQITPLQKRVKVNQKLKLKSCQPNDKKINKNMVFWTLEYEEIQPEVNAIETEAKESAVIQKEVKSEPKQIETDSKEPTAELTYTQRQALASQCLKRADTAYQNHDLNTAFLEWHQAMEWDLNLVYEPRFLFKYVQDYQEKNKLDDAIASYLKSDKTEADCYFLMLNFFFSINSLTVMIKPENLTSKIETALKQVEKKQKQGHYWLGICYGLQGKWQEAIEQIQTYITLPCKNKFFNQLLDFLEKRLAEVSN